MASPIKRDILRAHEVPKEYPLAESTLAMWRKQGKGPRFTKVDRRIFYKRADIEAFLSGQGGSDE